MFISMWLANRIQVLVFSTRCGLNEEGYSPQVHVLKHLVVLSPRTFPRLRFAGGEISLGAAFEGLQPQITSCLLSASCV